MTLHGHGRPPSCLRLLWMMIGLGLTIFPRAYGNTEEGVSQERLQTHLARTQAWIDELVGGSDLLDSLHFGWSDRPYTRATLAVLVKSMSVLQREFHLRQKGNGALSDEAVEAILLWRQQAAKRIYSPSPATGFRPHRIRISAARLEEASATASLYGIVDATTVTRHDGVLGDLDLVAALGFRVYGRSDSSLQPGAVRAVQRQRAHALGMATVGFVSRMHGLASTPRPPGEDALTVIPTTLADILAMGPSRFAEPNTSIALSDPPQGESWASRIARRSLARGVSGHGRFITAGWTPPAGRPSHEARAIEAAMWLDAIEGQSLGLIPGWRDLRDGSASVYPSLLPNPAKIEAIAVTALDLIRLGRCIAPFRSTPPIAVVVGRDAVDSTDDSAWVGWIEPVWAELLQRQVRYDVIGSAQDLETLQRRYRIVQPIRQDAAQNPRALVAAWEKRLTDQGGHIRRFMAWNENGTPARQVVVRGGHGTNRDSWLMIANLSADPRNIVLRPVHSVKQMRDLIADETVATGAVSLRPWQVRILTSSE